MASAYQKCYLELTASLEQNNDALKKLHSIYKLPIRYNTLPASATVQAMEMLGIFSTESPSGLIDLPLTLGMRSNHRKIKKKMKRKAKYTGFGGVAISNPQVDVIMNKARDTCSLLRGQLELLEMVMQIPTAAETTEGSIKDILDALDNVKELMDSAFCSITSKNCK